MKKLLIIIVGLMLSIYLTGCGKKQQAKQQLPEPVTLEELTAITTTPATPMPEPVTATTALEPLPPSGSFKPTNQEVQTALKNAGFYIGEIDGKIGPLTKKAIEEFQKANGLGVDGKVGPKTWAALSNYLKAPAETKTKKR